MSILCVLWQKSAERSISALNALSDESIDFFLQHDGYSSSAANRQSKFLGILTLCCTIRTTENVPAARDWWPWPCPLHPAFWCPSLHHVNVDDFQRQTLKQE